MRILLSLLIIFFMMSSSPTTTEAQGNGYRFGVGINQGCGQGYFGNRGSARRFESPPYFAKFPPVYYSRIVRRPYGISPYAAPSGIVPIEFRVPQAPLKIINPFVAPEPIADPEATIEETDGNKVT